MLTFSRCHYGQRQESDSILSPRTAFRWDFNAYILEVQSFGHGILLVGNFNENIGIDPDSMPWLIYGCSLVNVMTRLHGGTALPTAYARGHRCMDYAFATEHVASAVEKAGYEPFNARFPTDHRAYFIDLSIPAQFGIQLRPLEWYELKSFRII